jgi:large subunit ribosomal protein L35e
VKTHELRTKSKKQLEEQLVELKQELAKLRVQNAGASNVKSNRIGDVRKSIARVLTVLNQTQRDQVRQFYQDKKYLPQDLRPKLTRALRRRLSPEDAKRQTLKAKKRASAFPQRKYAIKA